MSGIRYLIISTIPSCVFILGNLYIYENYGTFLKNNIEIFLESSFNNFFFFDFFENINNIINNITEPIFNKQIENLSLQKSNSIFHKLNISNDIILNNFQICNSYIKNSIKILKDFDLNFFENKYEDTINFLFNYQLKTSFQEIKSYSQGFLASHLLEMFHMIENFAFNEIYENNISPSSETYINNINNFSGDLGNKLSKEWYITSFLIDLNLKYQYSQILTTAVYNKDLNYSELNYGNLPFSTDILNLYKDSNILINNSVSNFFNNPNIMIFNDYKNYVDKQLELGLDNLDSLNIPFFIEKLTRYAFLFEEHQLNWSASGMQNFITFQKDASNILLYLDDFFSKADWYTAKDFKNVIFNPNAVSIPILKHDLCFNKFSYTPTEVMLKQEVQYRFAMLPGIYVHPGVNFHKVTEILKDFNEPNDIFKLTTNQTSLTLLYNFNKSNNPYNHDIINIDCIDITNYYFSILNYLNYYLNNLNLNQNSILNEYFFLSINIALLLIIINISFKITAAPFHIWAPIIYNNGSIASVTFLAIFSKLVLFLFLINILSTTFYYLKPYWSYILFFMSLLSICFGMLGAFNEKLIKKFFIFSSMTDVGFMLLGFSFYTVNIYKFVINYLFVYNLSSIIIWMLLLYLKTKTKFLTNLQSILVNSAILNLIFSLNIFSLAGIPPFGGFFVKFDILINLILSSNYIIGFFLLLITVINFFYYLRLIKIIYFENNNFKVIYNIIDTLKLLLIIFIIYLVCGFELFMQHSFLFIIDKIFLSIL